MIACDLVSCRLYLYIYSPKAVRRSDAVCTEEDLEPADAEGFTIRALIYERGSLSLFFLFCLSPPRNETGVHILPSRSTTDHIEYIQEGFGRCVHTSCTNQAHYSLVRMCTPCTKPYPPPPWRSRSRVVVTSYHVLIGSATSAAHTHMVHIYVCRYSMCLLCHFTILSVTDPSVTQC